MPPETYGRSPYCVQCRGAVSGEREGLFRFLQALLIVEPIPRMPAADVVAVLQMNLPVRHLERPQVRVINPIADVVQLRRFAKSPETQPIGVHREQFVVVEHRRHRDVVGRAQAGNALPLRELMHPTPPTVRGIADQVRARAVVHARTA